MNQRILSTQDGYPPLYSDADSFPEEFGHPTGSRRPRIRWWVPSPYLSKEGVERDIHAMAEAGFSGIEVVPMPRYDVPGELFVEWGTPWWKEISRHMLTTAAKYHLTLDFTMTPYWPLSLPDITDAADPRQGAQMETDGVYVDGVTRKTPFDGPVPLSQPALDDAANAHALPRLAAVTCAKYLDKASHTLSYESARALVLGKEVLPEPNHPLCWRAFFQPEDDGEYVLFAWWEHPSGEKTCQNLQLDHYSAAATRALTDYWEEELIPSYGAEFMHTAAMFIDSLEYPTHLDWTHGFLEAFQHRNGYDISPYLPAIYDPNCLGGFRSFPAPAFRFDRCSEQLINDYGEFLTFLYIENHLKPLDEFCRRHGVSMRYQTAYGKILELAQTAFYVTIPETETLYGGDILDFYRLQSGAVHLSGKKIYSIEASAEMNGRGGEGINSGNYQQTWGDQLWHIQRAMACGVNQIVFHGYSYEGYYDGEENENGFLPGARWPGYTTMGYDQFSNNWSACQPHWIHVKRFTDFLARHQMVLRQGVGKIDLAIYRHSYTETIDYMGATKIYEDGGLLEQTGYSYDFISPSALIRSDLTVTGGRLQKKGASYGALIINKEARMPYDVLKRLIKFAGAGLAVVFVGCSPEEPAFHLERDIAPLLKKLLSLPRVKRAESTADVPRILADLGVFPRVRYRERCTLLNLCRHTQDADFYYFYNYANADSYHQAKAGARIRTAVTLPGRGTPCLLNAWTGEIVPIAAYEAADNAVTLPLELASNDSCIIALTERPEIFSVPTPVRHVASSEVRAEYGADGTLLVKSDTGAPVSLPLSDGSALSLDFPVLPASFPLTCWDLTLEKWSESPIPSESIKTLHTFTELERPVPWKELPGMEYASGVGSYHVSFHLSKGWEEGVGFYLDLGKICDSFGVQVNGLDIPVNQNDPLLDIGPYLHLGNNRIAVTVASTLLNALLDYSRRHSIPDARQPDPYGILGEVRLIPYAWRAAASRAQ